MQNASDRQTERMEFTSGSANAQERSRKRGRMTGFEEWGGYMAAKKEKLNVQFEDQKPQVHDCEAQIFKGVAIFVNGYTRPSAEELKQLMLKHGGTYHYYQHPQRTTHIIATNLPDSKVKNLKDDEKVVKPEWITDSIKASKLLPYQDYLLYTLKQVFGQATLNVTKSSSSVDQTVVCEEKHVANVGKHNDCSGANTSLPSCSEITEPSYSPSKREDENCLNNISTVLSSNVPSDDSSLNLSHIETHQLPSISETHKIASEKTQRSGFSVKAGDPQFLAEFYSHSRLHHISTAGQELKQYVQELIHAQKGKGFPGREKLKHLKESNSFQDGDTSKKAFCLSGEQKERTSNVKFYDERHRFTSASACSSRTTSGKVVMHIDMDCFFVSVGLRKYPELKGQPVAVTHSRGRRSTPQQGSDREYEYNHYRKILQQKIAGKDSAVDAEEGEDVLGTAKSATEYGSLSEIASCSYEARAAGLYNGMHLGEALRLCPNLKTIPYDFDGYSEVSRLLYDTIAEYTLDIEAVSCDELYVDCTELLEDVGVSPLTFTSFLRAEIFEKTGCTASAGMGSNMLLARLVTKVAKPNGQHFLPEDEVDNFMKEQKVEDLPGVGYIIASKLEHRGVITCGDLQLCSLEKLQKEFGPKNGQTLYDHCRGKDDREVTTQKERKSVSAEINYGIRFENEQDVRNFINELAVEVQQRLKKIGKKGKAVTLKLKMRKEDAPKQTAKFMGHGVCDSITKSVLLKYATNDPVVIANQCYQLIQGMKLNPEDYRGLGIQIGKLEPAADIEKSSKVLERFLSCATNNRSLPETSNVSDHEDVNIQEGKSNSSTDIKKQNNMMECFLSGAANNSCSVKTSSTYEEGNLDESVLNALPEDIRNEVLLMYGKKIETSPVKFKPVPNTKKSPTKVKGAARGRKKKVTVTSPQKTLKNHFEKSSSSRDDKNSSRGQPDSTQQSHKANLCGAVVINEVRDLLKEWFESMEAPMEDDTEHLKDYLLAVIEEKDLEKVDLVLKHFYRLASASNLLWREAYLSVLSYVQQKMLQDFGYMLRAQSDF